METFHWKHHRNNLGQLAAKDPDSYASKKRLIGKTDDRVDNNGKAVDPASRPHTILQRLDHLTWAWFTLTMSTGGLALLLGNQPHRFRGLQTIGKVVFVIDLVIFTILVTLISLRFARGGRKRLHASLTNPAESLFVPCFLLSIASIIPSIWLYGSGVCGPWLAVTVRVLFWIYVALSLLLAFAQYSLLFSGVQLTIHSMTPAWLLPMFPAMLSGTVAGAVAAANQPPHHALPIVVAGFTLQGLGFWTALFMYALFVLRLMQDGFPAADLRPGMFIAVGPPGFTSVALIQLARAVPKHYSFLSSYPEQWQVLQTMALCFSVFIWAVSFFFWGIGVIACLVVARRMSFHLVWYSWVFPNVGFTLALIDIGKGLQSQAIEWIGSVLTCILIAVYLFVVGAHFRAVVKHEILWTGLEGMRIETPEAGRPTCII